MLSSLDEMISPRSSETNQEELLTIYHAQAMHLCSQRFEGAVDISRMITQIVQSTPMQLPVRLNSVKSSGPPKLAEAQSPTSGSFPSHWDDLFVTRNYMKLRLALDYALITGRPPSPTDLPSNLFRDGEIARLSVGPINRLSAVTLHQSRKRRASESVAGLPRVVELDGDMGVSESHEDANDTSEKATSSNRQLIDQQSDSRTFSRPFFDYDTIWAASLFEEITDEIWS